MDHDALRAAGTADDGRRRWLRWALASAFGGVTIAGPAGAAEGETRSDAADGETVDAALIDRRAAALARAHRAVVGVRSVAVEGARSIPALGRIRLGSGVLVDDDGLVLTIGYLVLEAEQVDLLLADGRVVPAAVVAWDAATGFGLLRALLPTRLAPAPFGRAADADEGDALLVAARTGEAPHGAVSLAFLVSRRAFSGTWEYHIDAALYTAPARTDHSGAALFNADGELIGIGSLVMADVRGDAGPALPGNLFVPVDLLLPVLAELRDTGASRASRRAWLGIDCAAQAGELRVLRVGPGSPAEAAGVRAGDRIARIDGEAVEALEPFYRVLWRGRPAARDVTLEVRRGEAVLTLTLHAVDRATALRQARGV